MGKKLTQVSFLFVFATLPSAFNITNPLCKHSTLTALFIELTFSGSDIYVLSAGKIF